MKNSPKPKTFILSVINLILEILNTFLIFNTVITSIFKVNAINILQALGLIFAVSWIKLDLKKQKNLADIDENVLKRTVYYTFFFIISLTAYLIKRYCY